MSKSILCMIGFFLMLLITSPASAQGSMLEKICDGKLKANSLVVFPLPYGVFLISESVPKKEVRTNQEMVNVTLEILVPRQGLIIVPDKENPTKYHVSEIISTEGASVYQDGQMNNYTLVVELKQPTLGTECPCNKKIQNIVGPYQRGR